MEVAETNWLTVYTARYKGWHAALTGCGSGMIYATMTRFMLKQLARA